MNLKRIFALVAMAGGFAALVTSAATMNRRELAPPSVNDASSAAAEISGAELAAEVARLRERLHPTAAPQHPARNVFQFERTRPTRQVSSLPASSNAPLEVAPAPSAPALSLIGVAEQNQADGLVRTAIIAGFDQLFLVKEGEVVAERYRVVRIAANAVELKDVVDSTLLRLALP